MQNSMGAEHMARRTPKVLVTNSSEPLIARWSLNQTSGTNAMEQTGNAPNGHLGGTANFSGIG
jgi:hypothetical protein